MAHPSQLPKSQTKTLCVESLALRLCITTKFLPPYITVLYYCLGCFVGAIYDSLLSF